MDEIKIEKGIALPVGRQRTKYDLPIMSMEIGDSFLIPDVKSLKVSGLIHYYRMKTRFRLVTRSEEGGVRVWRTA